MRFDHSRSAVGELRYSMNSKFMKQRHEHTGTGLADR